MAARSSSILSSFALFAILSCSKSQILPENTSVTDSPKEIVSFSAKAPVRGETTMVTMDSNGKSQWESGDAITIYWEGGSCRATTTDSGPTASFTTEEAIPTDKALYSAVYPATRNASLDGTSLNIDFDQMDEAGTLACCAICTASTNQCGGSLAFTNPAAIIQFTTTSNRIHEARLYAAGHSSYVIVGSNSDSRVPYGSGTYYIPVQAGRAESGFSLRLKDYSGWDYPAFFRGADRTFEASHIYDVGTIESKVLTDEGSTLQSIKLMSFNILRGDLSNANHSIPTWPVRKAACLAMLQAQRPDILGLQECTSVQRNDILEVFPEYGAVGIAVDGRILQPYDNVSSNPILYNGNKFLLKTYGTFWLSETPGESSNTWYYNKPRTCTWARFKVKGSTQEFIYVCLHLQDNDSALDPAYSGQGATYGPECRARELNVVKEQLSSINSSGLPIIVSGDFNWNESGISSFRTEAGLASCRQSAPITDSGRTMGTSNGVLDHILFGRGFKALEFAVDRDAYAGVNLISDHYPVYAVLRFSGPDIFSSSVDDFTFENDHTNDYF